MLGWHLPGWHSWAFLFSELLAGEGDSSVATRLSNKRLKLTARVD
jgi:hypothetical protein